jgi:ABC-type multidrug transport system fused ATPase/permease subunit
MYFATFLALIAGLQAAATLHDSLLSNVLKCPMGFFDVTPKGRLLARFSHDVNTTDDRLINNIRQTIMATLRVR